MTKRLSLAALFARCSRMLGRSPSMASAQGPDAIKNLVSVDTTWVIVACVLVLFMQAGFLFLEIGFSRQKNVGAGVAKILVNLGIARARVVGGRLRDSSGVRANECLRHRRVLASSFGQDIAGVLVGGADSRR